MAAPAESSTCDELAPGFAANLLVAWAVSRAGRPDPAVEAEFRAAVTAARR